MQDNQNAPGNTDAQDQPQDPNGQPDPTPEQPRVVAQPLMGLVTLLQQYKAVYSNLPLSKQAEAKAGIPDPDSVELAISTALEWERTVKGGKVAQHDPTCNSLPGNQPSESRDTMLAKALEPLNALPDGIPGIDKDKMIADATANIDARFVCNCALSRKGKGGNRANPDNPGAKKVDVRNPADGSVTTVDSMSVAIKDHLIKFYPNSERLKKYMEYMDSNKAANARVFLLAAVAKKEIPEDAYTVRDATPAEEAASDATA